jgi:tetratricopeptide (TPR) repeat protein
MRIRRAILLDDKVRCGPDHPVGGGDPAIVARSYASWVGSLLGHLDISLKYTEEGVAIARSRRHAFSLAWALLGLGRRLTNVGAFQTAINHFDEAESLCKEHGFAARLAMIQMQRGATQCALGTIEAGLIEMRMGLEKWRQVSGNFHMSYYLANFADCLVRGGKGEQAEPVVSEAEAIAAATGERSQFGKILRLRGLLHYLKGDHQAARCCLLQSIDWSRGRKAKALEMRAAVDLVRLNFEAKDSTNELELLRSIVDWFPASLRYPDLVEARQLLHNQAHRGIS